MSRIAAERVDAHAHVFLLGAPLIEERRYTPAHDATEQDYLESLLRNGINRGVLVQPSFLGTDNSLMLNTLRRYPGSLRGVAVVEPDVSRATLEEMAHCGVVGIRLNLIGRPIPDFSEAVWKTLFATLAELDWHIEIHSKASELEAIVPPILAAGVRVVADHFGRPDPALGIDDPGFRYLLTLGRSGRVWVKLSGAYRNGPDGDAIAMQAVPLLKQAFGLKRLVWGSDWPHTQFENVITYEHTLQQLRQWLPDENDRLIVMRDSPSLLFGWQAGSTASGGTAS